MYSKMILLILTIIVTTTQISKTYANQDLWYQCAKLYKPTNYLDTLPHLNMPYVPKVPIPNNQDRILENNYQVLQKIRPTPSLTTKVLSVKTKYIYKNPICVKYTKKKKYCTPDSAKKRQSVEKLVTKEVFFRENESRMSETGNNMTESDVDFQGHGFSLMQPLDSRQESSEQLEGSMEPRLSTLSHSKTPRLTAKQINDLLIEDRLDQLETVLPNYTRRRKYQTSTIYVTKVISNKRNMATLMVQNCIPQGYQICPQKTKKRKSKVARFSSGSEEDELYFG